MRCDHLFHRVRSRWRYLRYCYIEIQNWTADRRTLLGVETRVEADYSINVPSLSTKAWLLCRAIITNQALVDREKISYYYPPLIPRVSLPPSLQSSRCSMARKSTSERNARTNHSVRTKRIDWLSFDSYAVIGSLVPFRCWFLCHEPVPSAIQFCMSTLLLSFYLCFTFNER